MCVHVRLLDPTPPPLLLSRVSRNFVWVEVKEGSFNAAGPIMRLLRIALLTLSQASSARSFVHPSPQALSYARPGGDASARAGAVGLRMVASAPASTVNAPAINGAAADRSTSSSSGRDAPEEGRAAEGPGEELRTVEMYDTTLRDGTQMEGISASVNDKLKIARQLADFGELRCFTHGMRGTNLLISSRC